MSTLVKQVNMSQDFVDRLNPKKNLRTWLKQALAEDDLALFFMYSNPPSEDECRYGVQFIDPSSLPIAPTAYYSNSGGRFSPRYWGTGMMGYADAATLLSSEWLEDFEKVNQLTGASLDHDGSSTLTLVPQGESKLQKTLFRYDWYTRCGFFSSHVRTVRPFKWAVLARKSAFNPRLRSWFGDGEHEHGRGTNYPADTLLFDFRGGIPLTVGTFGSEANIWLGHQLDTHHAQYKSFVAYPHSIEIGRVNVPLLGA